MTDVTCTRSTQPYHSVQGSLTASATHTQEKGELMHRRMLIATFAAFALAFTSIGMAATPAEAGVVDGWYTFYGKDTKTRSFTDNSPARTRMIIKLQKQSGAGFCRAQIVVKKGGAISRSQNIYKYSRNHWAWYSNTIEWPNRTKKTTITIKTNGNCQYRIWAR